MKKIPFIILVFLFFLPKAFAKIEASIEMKNYFFEGEGIEAELILKNLENIEREILIRAEIDAPFYISINPQEFFVSLKGLEEKEVEIEFEDSLSASKDYLLKVTLTGKNDSLLLAKHFEVIKKEIELFSCLDTDCENQTQIFYVGEKVCLSYSNTTAIRKFKIIYNNKEEDLQLPICLEDLKRGNYQLLAFTDQKIYSFNFSIIRSIKVIKKSKELISYKWFFVALLILPFIVPLIKKRKGQAGFFVKTISIVIASLIFVYIVYYFSIYQKTVEEEKAYSEFKNEVMNLAQKLISSEDCLSYKNEKGVIDVNKLEKFSSNYKDIEPDCAKEINFDYTVTVIQQEKKVAVLPPIKIGAGTLAWIPNSESGNSASLVSSDGREIRRHRTVPSGIYGDPSRTAVDSKGNAWVGNRGTNTLVKIAFDKKDCIDKNGNGIIETSEDKDNDGVVDESEMLSFDEDECIVANVRLGSNSGTKIRAVCIDNNDNVYAGHWNDKKIFYISSDGKIIKEWTLPHSPYGCVVDEEGNVWISAPASMAVIKLNPKDNSISTYPAGKTTYGIWRGSKSIVFTTWTYSSVIKISSNMRKEWEYKNEALLSGARGVFVDEDGNVYAVGSHTHKIVKLDNNGNLIKFESTCNTPTGVSMDYEGNIWVICMNGGVKIFTRDLEVVNEFVIRGSHYGYSDFTGSQTGARLELKEIKPQFEVEIKERSWTFSVGSDVNFGFRSFSPEKAKKREIRIAIPVTIRYNDTFSTEGIMHIYAVSGELEEFSGIIDYLCTSIRDYPERNIKFSKYFRFSYPVKMIDSRICMLEACKRIECSVSISMKEFERGEHLVNFEYDANKREITIS